MKQKGNLMKLLILGGTQFVGRTLVEHALADGHEVTLFNRGKTNPEAFADIETIVGDRDGGLEALGDRQWDAVIDTCGYVPRIVRQSAEYLRDKVERYVFISTISVYAESDQQNRDETAPLATLEDETTEEITGATYGGLKVLCEDVVHEIYGERALTVRPGLIVGAYDPTNRFTYWVSRIAKGGDVLAPGGADYPTQFIDARDLADFTLKLTTDGAEGFYNATGNTLTLGDVFATIGDVAGSEYTLHWADDAFLQAHEVGAFMEMPLWIPAPQTHVFNTIAVQKGIDTGLTFRPLADTVRVTLDWVRSMGDDAPSRAGMSAERETELLTALQSQ
jgi:2'-hydroxyisoflavone reductase